MIEPKPLSDDRAKEITEHFWQFQAILQSKESDQVLQEMCVNLITHMPGDFMDLISAEAYWREVVKKAHITGIKCYDGECPFCSADTYSGEDHKPDCPWLLAQEVES